MPMRPRHLVLRGLRYYWRTNLAVVAGVATAVAVLSGALLVGDSVRASLRDLVLQRLGNTDEIVVSAGFFREQLADAIQRHRLYKNSFAGLAPMVTARGIVTNQQSGRRAGEVRVYGVDDRFWRLHGVTAVSGPEDRQALVSPALARDLGAAAGSAILVRVERPSDIPLESLHGRKEDVGRTMRLTVHDVVPAKSLGEFSLEPQQADVRAVFLPLARLQQELEVGGRVNTLLLARTERPPPAGAVEQLERVVRETATPADLGLTVELDRSSRFGLAIRSEAGVFDERRVSAVAKALDDLGPGTHRQAFSYLANTLRVGTREIPYSLVTAVDLTAVSNVPNVSTALNAPNDPIVLNAWAARELQAKVGDELVMDFYVWRELGGLGSSSATFRVAAIAPVDPSTRALVPNYPGISDSPSLEDWDPPFPVDLRRIRPVDEAYWDQYRTTPKAFIPLEAGQRLWRTRYGAVTSLHRALGTGEVAEADLLERVDASLRKALDPLAFGIMVKDVRTEGLDASRGATDFGEYFVYFSFFLVVSALLLASLFFKLGIEQRAREVGLLRAVGYGAGSVRRLFVGEGLVLAIAGSVLGMLGAVGYAWLIMTALRTWWVDAVGTTSLALHVSAASLAAGAAGGTAAAVVCIWWTLRGLRRISERSLLAGQVSLDDTLERGSRRAGRGAFAAAGVLVIAGVALVVGASSGAIGGTGAFFGAGASLLAASLCLFAGLLRRPSRGQVSGAGWQPMARLGIRNATHRPGRSVLSAAVIASATFMLISVDAFRRDSVAATGNLKSGIGGYQVLVETLLPVVYDLNTTGRQTFGLDTLGPMKVEPFRLLPGDDASCLNLYEPKNPRILAPRDEFLRAGRFAFQGSLAASDQERDNPWLLLLRPQQDGAIPVIADANSMTYVLHRSLGEDMVITRGDRSIRLRFVAALQDSLFQGELLMSRDNFTALFPDQEGSRVFLIDTLPGLAASTVNGIEDGLSDYGADAMLTTERLAAFHRVENTYLSTFQTLGGLGLLLGTVGLATVLLRNALERRRELALLGAVGYRRSHFGVMVLAENVLLLAVGLAAGAAAATLAIAPAIAERGGRLPLTTGGLLLLFSVFVTGLLSSAIATRAVTHTPLLAALRSE
jgi:ABC-type lipoprotein release transport system permease subunit